MREYPLSPRYLLVMLQRSLAILVCSVKLACQAQTRLSGSQQTKNHDFADAPFTRTVKVGDSLPLTCRIGELFFWRLANSGSNLYGCTGTDIWTALASGTTPGGGSTSLEVQNDSNPVGSRTKLNLRPGSGATLACADEAANNRVTCTIQLNAAALNGEYVRLSANNSYAAGFLQDFSAAQLRVPAASNLRPTVNAHLGYDTNSQTLSLGRNGNNAAIALQDVSLQPLAITRPNSGSPGTVLNLLTKFDTLGNAALSGTADIQGVVGVAVSGAGTTGNVTIATIGVANCIADNNATIGNYAGIGTGSPGRCRDLGAAYPKTGQVVGRWLTAPGTGNLGQVLLFGLEHQSSRQYSEVAWGNSADLSGGASACHAPSSNTWAPCTEAGFAVSRAGGFSALAIHTRNAQPGTGALLCRLRVNDTDTGLTVTAPAGGSASSYVGTGNVTVNNGDIVKVNCTNNASSNALRIQAFTVERWN
jgi:hypothetical protein